MTGDIGIIIVIESLGNERKTGQELYGDYIKRNIEFRRSPIKSMLFNVNIATDLEEFLAYVQVNCIHMPKGILLHFEMHGDENLEGLILADGSLIKWKKLIELFRPINVASRNKLYISLATCYGRYLYEGVESEKKSPYSCYISASQKVSAEEIVIQFSELFESLIIEGNLIKAYLQTQSKERKFYYKDSETTFEEAFKEAANRILLDKTLESEMIKNSIQKMRKNGIEVPPIDILWRDLIPIKQQVIRDTYEKHKATFNFLDLS